MKKILKIVEDVAKSNSNVLFFGETGVGKEVLARKLHETSNRANMPFMPINSQYYSPNLLESELFGHEKGAFTNANEKRIGRFEEAHGGTIFLDEIGELSHDIQVKFLRVLENKTIERMGSNKQINIDIRIISATNKDLLKEVKENRFREDLFYRINTITINIPPLRERKEDLEDMIFFFIQLYEKELKKPFKNIEGSALNYLLNYDYPGNIRELRNIVERMFVLSQDGILRLDNLNIGGNMDVRKNKMEVITNYNLAKKKFEKEYFLSALKFCNYNITETAKTIGISSRQLFNKINEYNLRQQMK